MSFSVCTPQFIQELSIIESLSKPFILLGINYINTIQLYSYLHLNTLFENRLKPGKSQGNL